MRQDPTGMLDTGPGEPGKAGNIDTEPRKLLSIKRVEGLDGVVYYVPVYGNPIAPTVDATKKDYNGLNSVPPELKLHNIADGGTMSQTRETWADSWRVSEPISYSLINDAYGGVQGLPFFGDLLKRGASSSVSNLDGTTNQDPIGSFINTAAMFFGGGSGKLVPKHLSVRVFRWFNKFMPWKAAKGGIAPLGLGSTAKVGVSRVNPVNITEELALKEIMGNPSMGNIAKLKKGMTDSRWHQNDGWQKMTWNNGGVEIHYVGQWQNGVLKAVDDFKIIGK